MTLRRRGMDHGLYPYTPLSKRKTWTWPNGKRIAVCIYLYFEYWELDPAPDALQDRSYHGFLGALHPNYFGYTAFEYGNRVGVFRILDLLDRYHLTATVAANAGACARYPFLVQEFKRRGFEFAAHNSFATRMISSNLSEAQERAEIAEAVRGVAASTGQRPKGWISQDFGESTRTPELLAEAGLSYVVDWGNDDRPYFFSTEPPLVSIPNQMEWDDVQAMWHRRLPPSVYVDSACDAFNCLYEEGGSFATYFGLHLHPWLTGKGHRIRYLDRILGKLATTREVWHATAGEICDSVPTGA